MKKVLSVVCLISAIVGSFAVAQPDQRLRPEGASDGRPPDRRPDPLLQLFDTDDDQQLSTEEIDAIAGALRQCDADNNGLLTQEELPRPPRPEDHPMNADKPRPAQDPSRPIAPRVAQFSLPVDTSKMAKGTIVFRGGFETEPQDGGRPVRLIAAALGVDAQVFREAFENVRPARNGAPTPERARENKAVLMAALSPHGVTNDRLDEVSNYYRYRPQEGELWKHRPARAEAVITEGGIHDIKILDAGAGYTATPRVEIVGYPGLKVTAKVEYRTDLRTNGRISSVQLAP